MKIKIAALLPFFFFCICLIFPQEQLPPTNKEVLISFLNELSDTLIKNVPPKTMQLHIFRDSLSDLVESIIVSKLSNFGYRFQLSTCDTCSILQIAIENYKINYKRLIRERPTQLIFRKIEFNVVSLYKEPNLGIAPIIYNKIFSDTITTEFIDYVEREGSPFAGKKPKEPENFLKKYFEPIIIIGSSALAIFLFFTIRSK